MLQAAGAPWNADTDRTASHLQQAESQLGHIPGSPADSQAPVNPRQDHMSQMLQQELPSAQELEQF